MTCCPFSLNTPLACSDFDSPYPASLSQDSFVLSSSPCCKQQISLSCARVCRALFLESTSTLPLSFCTACGKAASILLLDRGNHRAARKWMLCSTCVCRGVCSLTQRRPTSHRFIEDQASAHPDTRRLALPPVEKEILCPHSHHFVGSRSGCSSSGWIGGWSFWSVFPITGIHSGRLYHRRRLCMYLTSIHNANEGT